MNLTLDTLRKNFEKSVNGTLYSRPSLLIDTIRELYKDTIQVPEECERLVDAVNKVHGDNSLTTIVLAAGTYKIDNSYLKIDSAMKIVGDPEKTLYIDMIDLVNVRSIC